MLNAILKNPNFLKANFFFYNKLNYPLLTIIYNNNNNDNNYNQNSVKLLTKKKQRNQQ